MRENRGVVFHFLTFWASLLIGNKVVHDPK